LLKIDFILIFWQNTSVLYSQIKIEKIKKDDFWGLYRDLIWVKMDPNFLKKNTMQHIVPRTSRPEKIKKYGPTGGTICEEKLMLKNLTSKII
jgi:hypothetical protein